MKRIGLVSDSHENPAALARVLRAMGRVDMLIHLGDGLEDLRDEQVRSLLPAQVLEVRGNNDWRAEAPPVRLERLDAQNLLYLAHGHHLGVKYSLDRLYYAALETGAAVACYGHTHRPKVEFEGGIWLINPGAVRAYPAPCYAVLELEDGRITPRLFAVKEEEENRS